MAPEFKICGLTRAEDAAAAARLGASYVGVVFEPSSPRAIAPARARDVLDAAVAGPSTPPRRVGVFGRQPGEDILACARGAGLEVLQLHAELPPGDRELLEREFDGTVWRVVRVGPGGLGADGAAAFAGAAGVVLDTASARGLGGTGETFAWSDVAAGVQAVRGTAALIVAGGLTAHNVRSAIAALHPDVVDVSSGVEQAPGLKDETLMAAFAAAVKGA